MAKKIVTRNRGRKWTWNDLLEEANKVLIEEGLEGIGKTQFYADMQYMEMSEWKAPIEKFKEGRTVFFKYSDANYSINNQPLSTTESEQLKSAINILSRFKGMPQFEWVNEIIPAIETKLGLVGNSEREIIAFESNLDYEGLLFITPLFNAIINNRVLKVSYQDFKSPIPYDVEFHPYYLKQYNNRWFVFGNNPEKKIENWNMALDRIKGIEETKEKYILSDINWDDYFSDFIGVTKLDTKPITITILIRDIEQASYIRTKPLHQTQKPIKQVKDGFETSIEVIPNYELERLILSFGERIKILSPKPFQKRIAKRFEESLMLYSK